MNIQMSLYNNNTSFMAKEKLSIKIMNEKLVSLVNAQTPIVEIARLTGYTPYQIRCWSEHVYHMPLSKLYKVMTNNHIKNDLLEQRKSKTSIDDIANKYNHSPYWVIQRLRELDILPVNTEKQNKMKNKIPEMIHAGYTLHTMSVLLQLATSTIRIWIVKNLGCSLSEYRKIHNIKKGINIRFKKKPGKSE